MGGHVVHIKLASILYHFKGHIICAKKEKLHIRP